MFISPAVHLRDVVEDGALRPLYELPQRESLEGRVGFDEAVGIRHVWRTEEGKERKGGRSLFY